MTAFVVQFRCASPEPPSHWIEIRCSGCKYIFTFRGPVWDLDYPLCSDCREEKEQRP